VGTKVFNRRIELQLDEVVDPQNFGALLRSAYFLGGSSSEIGARIGVLVCEKNSAPPSPVVSAASAGALEISQIYSTSNLPRLLNGAKEDGWRILGAAAYVPNSMRNDDDPVECMNLSEIETGPPTLLVLGSEGSGLRTLVARACTGFVKIPGSEAAQVEGGGNAGVDSLNVSVTGGIMLWHLLNDKK
jgi:21S rRNA (GM2251-2'-O)-methyltransferase